MIFLYILGGIAMATLLFANFAEALTEGRGKAQAATLRKAHRHVGETAHRF